MQGYFIDTNIILRLLLRDNQFQYRLAKRIFELGENRRIEIWTTDVVILELVWTLKSLYRYNRQTIRDKIDGILALSYLDIGNKKLILQALDSFATKNVDFADAYNFQLAKKENKKILSFDDDYKKLGSRVNIRNIAGK